MNVTNFILMNCQKILGLTALLVGFGLLFLPLVHASDLSPCPPQGPFHDCFGSYTWTSGHREGDRYLGEFKNNKFHGYGTYLWAPNTKYVQSGSIYSGQWKNGVKDGPAPTFGRMVINLLVNGEAHAQVVSWKVLVFTLGMMELCTLGNFQQRVPAKEESTVMAK